MAMQRAWNDLVRGANGIGVAEQDGEKIELDHRDQIALSREKGQAKAQLGQSITSSARRGGLYSLANKVGSFFVKGASAPLSVDEEGTLGFNKSFSPTELTTSFVSRSTSPVIGGLSFLDGLNTKAKSIGANLYDHKSYDNFETFAEANKGRREANKQRRSAREGDNGSFKPKSLTERAQQVLYPQEEDKPQLGVGVSQGKSKVRRAPQLSVLNVRRPSFGRG